MGVLRLVAQEAVTVQPRIMVVPFVKQGEDIRTVLENDVNKRIVMAKIREAFDSRGFTTVDFLARLKSLSNTSGLTMDNQSDLKSMIIQQSGADVYVDAEMNVVLSSTGNSVKVIVTAYDISTGNSLSNKVGDSGKFYTDDIGRLASKAIKGCADDFLNTMYNPQIQIFAETETKRPFFERSTKTKRSKKDLRTTHTTKPEIRAKTTLFRALSNIIQQAI